MTFAAATNGPLKHGDEMYRYLILDSSHRPDNVRIKVNTHVCFDEPGPMFGLKVVRVLEDVHGFIRHVVFNEVRSYL